VKDENLAVKTVMLDPDGGKDRWVEVAGRKVFVQKIFDMSGTLRAPFLHVPLYATWGGHQVSHAMTDSLFSHHNDAAPLGSVRLAPALLIDGPRRQRRRGPRSQIALLRRSVPKHRRTLPVSCLGEFRHIETESISSKKPHNFKNINFSSESVASVASACNLVHDVFIYSVNSQCLFAHKHCAELCFQLEVHSPHAVCVQETWLDDSTKEATIPGYVICSRRDRHKGANRGGIAVFRREDFNGIVHITNSEKEERS